MKTKIVAALAAFAIVFTACNKDDDNTNNGGSTDTQDYQPTSAGSNWQFSSSTSGNYTETATGADSTIDGEKYFVFDNSSDGRQYINKNGGVYKSYSYFEQIQSDLKLTYLKDAEVGATWDDVVNYEYNGFTVPITFDYKIASRDADMTVNNKTYNNVITVDTKISASSLVVGGDGTIATGHRSYAKGVGVINSVLDFNALGTSVKDSTYLLSYEIK